MILAASPFSVSHDVISASGSTEGYQRGERVHSIEETHRTQCYK